MHWGDRFLKGLGCNVLTQPAFDPLSKQPELKQSCINIRPAELQWELFLLVEGKVQERFEAIRPLCEGFDYLGMGLIGRDRPALLLRAASIQAPDAELLAQIDALAGLDSGPVLSYEDPAMAVSKRVRLDQQRITAVRLSGETAARNWLRSLWLSGEPASELSRWLLAPISTPPGAASACADKTLCNCIDVSQSRICAGIERGLNLDDLKQELGCGTQCGSCVPEIKRLIASLAVPA